jgi:hypothetical protein
LQGEGTGFREVDILSCHVLVVFRFGVLWRDHGGGWIRWRVGLPSVVNEAFVSPRPWRRMRILTVEPVGGGTMSSVRLEGKSAFVGSLG